MVISWKDFSIEIKFAIILLHLWVGTMPLKQLSKIIKNSKSVPIHLNIFPPHKFYMYAGLIVF